MLLPVVQSIVNNSIKYILLKYKFNTSTSNEKETNDTSDGRQIKQIEIAFTFPDGNFK